MADEIKVTIHGRKRVLPLHHWFERIDAGGLAMILRCELVQAGTYYAYECFALLNPEDKYRLDHVQRAALFLAALRSQNGGHMDSYAYDLPFVRDFRNG